LKNLFINGSAGTIIAGTIFSSTSFLYCTGKTIQDTSLNILLNLSNKKTMVGLLDKIIFMKKKYESRLVGYEDVSNYRDNSIRHDCPREVEEIIYADPHGQTTKWVTCPTCKGEGYYYEQKGEYLDERQPVYVDYDTNELMADESSLNMAEKLIINRNNKYQIAVLKLLQQLSPDKAKFLAERLKLPLSN